MNNVSPIKDKVEEFGDDSEFSTVLPGAESTGVHDRICECVYILPWLGTGCTFMHTVQCLPSKLR